jgi:hypothetical protein
MMVSAHNNEPLTNLAVGVQLVNWKEVQSLPEVAPAPAESQALARPEA